MPLACPHCRRVLEVPAELLGETAGCPHCGGVFATTAPTPRRAAEPPPAAPRLTTDLRSLHANSTGYDSWSSADGDRPAATASRPLPTSPRESPPAPWWETASAALARGTLEVGATLLPYALGFFVLLSVVSCLPQNEREQIADMIANMSPALKRQREMQKSEKAFRERWTPLPPPGRPELGGRSGPPAGDDRAAPR